MKHHIEITEEQRQLIILALAKLSLSRPGWRMVLGEIAAGVLRGATMWGEFRKHGPDPAIKIATELQRGNPLAPVVVTDLVECKLYETPEQVAARLQRGGGVHPPAFDCECGAGPERLSTWYPEPPGWKCKSCGGFVERNAVTFERNPNRKLGTGAVNYEPPEDFSKAPLSPQPKKEL